MQLSLRKNKSNIFNLKTITPHLTSIQERVQFKLLLRKDILNNKLHSKRLNATNTSSSATANAITSNPTMYNFITSPYEYFSSLTNEHLILNGLNYVFNYITHSHIQTHTHHSDAPISIKPFQESFMSCINSIIKTYMNNENIMILIIKLLTSLCDYNLLANSDSVVNDNKSTELFEFTQEIFFNNVEYISNYINMYSFYYEVNEIISLLTLYFLGYCVQDSNAQ